MSFNWWSLKTSEEDKLATKFLAARGFDARGVRKKSNQAKRARAAARYRRYNWGQG